MNNTRKNLIFAVSLVATGFFWFGSAWFSYLEVLKARFDADTIFLLTSGLSYGAQILGILVYIFIVTRNKRFTESRLVISLCFGLSAIGILGAFFTSNNAVFILSGVLFNLFGTSGVMLGYQFHCVTSMLPRMFFGRAFGFAYAVGSLATALLAVAFNGRCPVGYAAVIIYILFIILNFLLIIFKGKLTNEIPETAMAKCAKNNAPESEMHLDKNLILMFAGVILLMVILQSISGIMQGLYLDVSNQISMAFARMFYAFGLIPASLLIDYNRRMGAIACLLACGFSFFLILLYSFPVYGFIAMGLDYVLIGFFAVYRTVSAMDIASRAPKLLYFSVMGILLGRLGEVAFTIFRSLVQLELLLETLAASIFFLILILILFPFMRRMYDPVLLASDSPVTVQMRDDLLASFGITRREAETLSLLLSGKTTLEISEAMSITDRTVQKYIGSMMAKTNSKSRSAMIAMFARHSN